MIAIAVPFHRAVFTLGIAARLFVSVLSAILIALVPLAYASPPDETWIGGFYDDADHDDAVSAITDADGVCNAAALGPFTGIGAMRSSVVEPRCTLPFSPPLACFSRGPPRSNTAVIPAADLRITRAMRHVTSLDLVRRNSRSPAGDT